MRRWSAQISPAADGSGTYADGNIGLTLDSAVPGGQATVLAVLVQTYRDAQLES